MSDLGLNAVATGGASGIGAATVDELHSRGARVAVIDRVIADPGGHTLSIAADICSKGEVADATTGVVADHVHAGFRVNTVVSGTADKPW